MEIQAHKIEEVGKDSGRYYYKTSEYGSKNWVDDPQNVVVVMDNPNPDYAERRLYFDEFEDEYINHHGFRAAASILTGITKTAGKTSDNKVRASKFFNQDCPVPRNYVVDTLGPKNNKSVKEWDLREKVVELLKGQRRFYLVYHKKDLVFQVTDADGITVKTLDGREVPITSYLGISGRPQPRREPRRQTGTGEREFPHRDSFEDKLR